MSDSDSPAESSTAFETVNLSIDPDGVATIELNRPEALNAWNRQFGRDLLAALRQAEEDDVARAVVITGAGRAFSSGADLKDFGVETTPEGRPNVYKVLTERYHPIMHAIRELPLPVVACVNGPAAGPSRKISMNSCPVSAQADSFTTGRSGSDASCQPSSSPSSRRAAVT